MKNIVPSAAVSVFLIVCTSYLHGQTSPQARTAPSPREFFQKLMQQPSPLPKFDELLKVQDEIGRSPRDELANSLPTIIGALGYSNIDVKICAAAALSSVSDRPDSALLLGKYIMPIANLFNAPDARLQGTPSLIFLNLKPAPPPVVVPVLLDFVKRTDRDEGAQASAVSVLARTAPQNAAVLQAIRDFLSRPEINREARITAMNGATHSRVKDAQITGIVIESLHDPDQSMRFTAAQSLKAMGPDAVRQAEPLLVELVKRPDEAADVKAAAREALRTIGHSAD